MTERITDEIDELVHEGVDPGEAIARVITRHEHPDWVLPEDEVKVPDEHTA